MIVRCDKCLRTYDDAQRWTICPHNPLHLNPKADLGQANAGVAFPQTQMFRRASTSTSKFAVLTRANFIQEVLSIWDQTVQLDPSLRDEYEIAHAWLTKTWTVEELTGLPLAALTGLPLAAWWKFWREDRETFAEAWTETKVLMLELRRKLGM